jgi:hypothetical protein
VCLSTTWFADFLNILTPFFQFSGFRALLLTYTLHSGF